jgi:hypothetical protein
MARDALTTAFRELNVVNRTPIIELNPVMPLSDLRDDQQTSGSASITNKESEFKLTHSAAGDFVRLASSSRGRYQPGTIAEVGAGIRFSSSPPTSGDYTVKWGLLEMNTSSTETIENAALFGHDKDGFFVEVIRAQSSTKIRESNFNQLANPSIDFTKGYVFRIQFGYYGYLPLRFQWVEKQTGEIDAETKDLHTFIPEGETSLENTNMKVGAVINSSSGTGSFDVFLAGRQYTIIGNYEPRSRVTPESVTGVSVGTSGWTQLISFKKKSGFREVPVDFESFSANTDNDIQIRLIRGNTLSNDSFGSLTNVPDGETAVEVDTSADGTTGGRKTHEDIIAGGGKGKVTQGGSVKGEVPVDIVDEGIITLEAQAIDSSATVDAVLRAKEIW